MAIKNLKINHIEKPFGISITGNTFSFNADDEENFTAILYLDGTKYCQKEVSFRDSIAFQFDKDLLPGKEYKYEVKGQNDKASIFFETADILDSKIICEKEIFAPVFTKSFSLSKRIVKARLYITGLGLYRAFINGNSVGENYLTPYNNDYDAYLRYQTYDVTSLLKNENIISVSMGDGWYKGRFGIDKPIKHGDKVFGEDYKLCAKLVIFYNSYVETIRTDETWKVCESQCIMNNIYDGESWNFLKSSDTVKSPIVMENSYHLIPDFGSGITKKKELKPELYISPKNEYILDFKQNMVGFVKITNKLPKGTKLILKHGEVLQDECFYNANLRTAKAQVEYVADGIKEEYEPIFTYYGFRYVLVEGLDKVDPNDFTGVVIYTDLSNTLKCETDNKKINQLLSNAMWGQRGNFLDVPTDCPQRDERLGWTADTQVFVNTACYQMDSYNFYQKYLMDLRYDQTMYYEGDLPMYCPSLKHEAGNGGAVWADAGTIIPWNLYMNYGDKNLLRRDYSLMKDYTETLIKRDQEQGGRNLILYGFTFGDWLAQDGVCSQSLAGGTDNAYIMSVYYYNSVKLTAKAAKELDYLEDSNRYEKKAKQIYNAILDEYFAPSGKLALDTQTSYVLSLYYGIYRNKERVISDFKNRLSKDLYRMKTGFTGTPLILPCLFDNGMDSDAYRILFNEECPGWLYAINLGATTIWERWNSLLPDGKISGINMNSLNHYAYGSVCEAIYSRIAGLKNLDAGWRKVEINPHLNYRLKHMKIEYNSVSGIYKVNWNMIDETLIVDISIPYGARANVILPGVCETVNVGEYHYECKLPNEIVHPFNLETPNLDIIHHPIACEALKSTNPRAYYMVTGENDEFKISNGHFLAMLPMFGTSKESMEAYLDLLTKIKP